MLVHGGRGDDGGGVCNAHFSPCLFQAPQGFYFFEKQLTMYTQWRIRESRQNLELSSSRNQHPKQRTSCVCKVLISFAFAAAAENGGKTRRPAKTSTMTTYELCTYIHPSPFYTKWRARSWVPRGTFEERSCSPPIFLPANTLPPTHTLTRPPARLHTLPRACPSSRPPTSATI